MGSRLPLRSPVMVTGWISMMKQAVFLLGFGFWIMGLFGITGALASNGSVLTIESPKPGQVIQGPDVVVKWKLVKEGRVDHVHVYLNGELYKPVKSGDSLVIKDLEKGNNEITVQASTSDHELLAPKATVKIKVE